jgi:glycogen debranching enzyme
MSVAPGARVGGGGTQFAVRARDADQVTLCLFDGDRETQVAMTRQNDMHIAFVPGAGPGQRYGFRATGPWSPEQGHFFDSAKLLLDPYATALDRRFVFDSRLGLRNAETAALVPKAIVMAPLAPVPHRAPLFAPGGLIYELNVRSFTLQHPQMPQELRGTIAALAHPAVIAHLQKLHVNAVELMPVIGWIDERHLATLGLRNAWGYNSVVPMALDPGLAPGGLEELRRTVAALQDAGIGVILDLVFNHTGEGDLLGPTLSLRGLDNRCYARAPDGWLINDTGTGNTLDGADPAVRSMILDTLRHFVRSCGVDGFRFDLATVMARNPGFDPGAPIFAQIAGDPLLADRVMIAEPWDIGPGGYQLGNFPTGWLEWNDRYRDDVRRFWRGDPHMARVLATRITGSADVFRGATSRSVNFIASHDGFPLADLAAYRERHNEANGENNADGQIENFSWNNGVEGPSDDPAILARRMADICALLATLFASKGTILLTAGDEFGRSQKGNNNAYAQDNPVTWIDWDNRDRDLENYAAQLSAIRAAYPMIGDPAFLEKADWHDLDGEIMTPEKWESADLAGFTLRLPLDENNRLAIRIDRRTPYSVTILQETDETP